VDQPGDQLVRFALARDVRDHGLEIWKTTPFMALLLLAGLSQISEDMLEAAQVDGPPGGNACTR
jgi:ABC-type sugar transport systems, permease components